MPVVGPPRRWIDEFCGCYLFIYFCCDRQVLWLFYGYGIVGCGLLKLVEIGVGHDVGFWILHGWTLVLLSSMLLYIYIYIYYNMGFCSNGILVGSGQWWHGGHGGGAVVVTRQWRRGDRG